MQASDRQGTMARPGCSPAAAESRSPDDRQGHEADPDGSSRQLRALFDRLPELALDGPPRRRTTRVLRGFDAMPVRLG